MTTLAAAGSSDDDTPPLRRKTDVPFTELTVEQALNERLAELGRMGTLEQRVGLVADRQDAQSRCIDFLDGHVMELNRQVGLLVSNIHRLANEQTAALKAQTEILQIVRELKAGTLGNGHSHG